MKTTYLKQSDRINKAHIIDTNLNYELELPLNSNNIFNQHNDDIRPIQKMMNFTLQLSKIRRLVSIPLYMTATLIVNFLWLSLRSAPWSHPINQRRNIQAICSIEAYHHILWRYRRGGRCYQRIQNHFSLWFAIFIYPSRWFPQWAIVCQFRQLYQLE